MPTGYTAIIDDNPKATFNDYLLRCARAFGAMIHMREEPLDAPLRDRQPSDYHAKELAKAQARIAELNTLTDEGAQAEADAAYRAAETRRLKYLAEAIGVRDRYAKMRGEVMAWKPPTPEHAQLKTFMLEQLTTGNPGSAEYYERLTPDQTGVEWKAEELRKAERDLEYHTVEHGKELARVQEGNAWIRALNASLLPKD